MSAQVVPLRPSLSQPPPHVAGALRHAQSALALIEAGCLSLAQVELMKGAVALEQALAAPERCPECGGTGFDEDARCDFCDGTGRGRAPA